MLDQKKKTYGHATKPRTAKEIDLDFQKQIAQAGFKATQIKMLEADHDRLTKEYDEHVETAVKLRKEYNKLPPKPVAAAPEPTPPQGEPIVQEAPAQDPISSEETEAVAENV